MEPPKNVRISQHGRWEVSPYSEADKLFSVFSPRAIKIVRKMRNADVVIAHRFPFTVFEWLSSKLFGTKYVLWSWPSGPSMDEFSGLARVWAHIQHYLETEHITVRDATYICLISDDSLKYIGQKTGRDTVFVPFNIDTDRLSHYHSQQDINDKLGIDDSTIVVLYVGRIIPRKNVLELVEIFGRIHSESNDLKLLVVGGETMEEYSNETEHVASDDVKFLRYIDDGSFLGGVYERVDVYATCSQSERWSTPIAEAKHFDTPVVAFDSVPAAQELEQDYLVQDGEFGQFEKELRRSILDVQPRRGSSTSTGEQQ